MLSAVAPSRPSENIFAKDPIEAIGDFLMSNCTTPSDSRNGITIRRL
jgi:hypothetical protein